MRELTLFDAKDVVNRWAGQIMTQALPAPWFLTYDGAIRLYHFSLIVFFLAQVIIYWQSWPYIPLWLSGLSMTAMIIADLFDAWTTHQCSVVADAYQVKGLTCGLYETREDLPRHPKLRDILLQPASLAEKIKTALISLFLPFYGFAQVVGSLCAGFNNRRVSRIATLQLALADELLPLVEADTTQQHPKKRRHPKVSLNLIGYDTNSYLRS